LAYHRGSSAPITVRDLSRRSLPFRVVMQTKASAALDLPNKFSPLMTVTEKTYRCLADVEGLTIRAVSSASIAYTRSSSEIWAAPISVSLTHAYMSAVYIVMKVLTHCWRYHERIHFSGLQALHGLLSLSKPVSSFATQTGLNLILDIRGGCGHFRSQVGGE
jgi:hypothetical protein